jgi:hypothetical protein
MRFLSSAKYRRKVIIQKPFKGFCKIVQQKRNPETKMQIDFPSENQIGQLKNAVDAAEIKLRGGSIFSDYDTMVKGTKVAAETGLKAWDTGVTIAKSGNAFGEIALGAHALAESIVEWKKGHYICCVCSGVACSCFFVGAIAGLFPGGYTVWQGATQAGGVAKGVTYTCRRITGGGI